MTDRAMAQARAKRKLPLQRKGCLRSGGRYQRKGGLRDRGYPAQGLLEEGPKSNSNIQRSVLLEDGCQVDTPVKIITRPSAKAA